MPLDIINVNTGLVFAPYSRYYQGMGFCPSSIESTDKPADEPLAKSYDVLTQLSPVILANQGKETMNGMLFEKKMAVDTIRLGGYTLICKHDTGWAGRQKRRTTSGQ